VTNRTKDKRVFAKEQIGYEGRLTNPMSWERTVEKFHWLAEAFADEELRCGLIRAVEHLDTSRLSNLTGLLGQVR
jgi:2-methylcitrate dehydratase